MDRILTLPMPHEEFFNIYRQTKKLLFQGKLSVDRYIAKIKICAFDGLDENEIVDEIKKTSEEEM